MKKIIKNITPPLLYTWAKNTFSKPRRFQAEWVTLSYTPMLGVKMFFDPTGPWQKKLLDSSYDSFFFDRLKKMDMQGKTIFDIGAHIGFHSLYFARLVGAKGHVYSFEPNPKNVERFLLILDNNPDLKKILSVFPIALSNKKATEEFTAHEDVESGRSSGSFIESADPIWDKSAFKQRGFIKQKVKTLSLDEAFKELGILNKPDMLKIDVEGAESLVLEGGEKTIQKYKPIILMEVHSMSNMLRVASFLCKISYTIEILKEESDGRCFIQATPKAI
jgi:FkbM family methyltransferase